MSTPAAIESWSEDPVGLKAMEAAKAVSYIGATLNNRVGNALDGNWAVQALMVLDVAAALPDASSDDKDPAADELSLDLDKPKPKHGLGQLHISHLLEMVLEDAQTGLFFKAQSVIQSDLLVAFGLKYKSYCANVGRTFFVDPTPEMLTKIKPGISTRDVYHAALAFVKEKKAELEKNFVKNVSFGTGLEFHDSPYLLGPKTNRTLKENMTLSLGLRFTDLVDSAGNKYALQLVDTIKIKSDKSVLLTDGACSVKDTEKQLKKKKQPPSRRAPTRTTRHTQDEVHQTAATKLAEHQRELHDALQAAGLERYSEEGGGQGRQGGQGWKKFQSYRGEGGLPGEVEKLRVQTVILPIHGFAVPFHINTTKNASKNDEAEFTYLRINFQTPRQLAGKKEDTPFEDPEATFICSVVFRSPDNHRFDSICKQITDLK
ncbi:FACT complex subunit-domain-containing protein [Mycena olivaceomarginata]|nr:FACT complex subunit-domain-containing protein [Mycena olivaceomarginata]